VGGQLHRLGALCVRHRWRVIAAWIVLLVVAAGIAGIVRRPASSAFTVPGAQSQRALDLLDQRFPGTGGAQAQVVFAVKPGQPRLSTVAHKAAIEGTLAQLRRDPEVVAVTDPYADRTVSSSGLIAYSTVAYPVSVDKVSKAATRALLDAGGPARAAGMSVNFGGALVAQDHSSDTEAVGAVVAFMVLFVGLGSALAAGLPLLTALIGVGTGLAGILALGAIVTESTTAPVLAIMITLAVGIDYALFIATRHRQQLLSGVDLEASIATAVATAGGAVCFAGSTVVVALAALTIAGIPFLTVMGLCAAGAVIVAVTVALTLVPALLSLMGRRLVTGRPAARQSRRSGTAGYRSMGRRWVDAVTHRPVVVLTLGIVALLILAGPAHGLRLALPDAGTHSSTNTDRRAFDKLSTGFGPGANGPLLLVIAGQNHENAARIGRALAVEARAFPDIAAISPPLPNAAQTVTLVSIVPKSGPTDARIKALVSEIRRRAATIADQARTKILVTGATAVNIDTSSRLSQALPPYLVVVAAVCVALLMLVFRSIVVALTAVLGYLLSVGAALGTATFVFQEGHLSGGFGVPTASPVVSFLPILLLGILFGLAMDYEVFLVSRMQEAYARSGDPATSVVQGFAASARVVCAAGIIMTSVFASFIFTQDLIIKSIGFSLAVGVLVDAFVVRMTLLPSTLALAGRSGWWLPTWLDHVMPHVNIEGATVGHGAVARD
jgi:RND superfamily putative drug exporter